MEHWAPTVTGRVSFFLWTSGKIYEPIKGRKLLSQPIRFNRDFTWTFSRVPSVTVVDWVTALWLVYSDRLGFSYSPSSYDGREKTACYWTQFTGKTFGTYKQKSREATILRIRLSCREFELLKHADLEKQDSVHIIQTVTILYSIGNSATSLPKTPSSYTMWITKTFSTHRKLICNIRIYQIAYLCKKMFNKLINLR